MTLKDRYPEMQVDGDDAALERLVTDLDRTRRASRAALPAQSEMRIAHALQERAVASGRNEASLSRARSVFRHRRSLALGATMALSVLMVIGATYAAVPVLTRVFDLGGAGRVIQQNLGKQINLSQRLAGYTMNIRRVYADPNRVLIAYSIRPPASNRRLWNMATGNLTLTDGQGTILPERSLVGVGGGAAPEWTLQAFDAAAIAGNPAKLHLHLTVPWIEAMEQLHAQQPGRSSMQTFPGLPPTGALGSVAVARPLGERDPWMQVVRTYGPIAFEFTIPFERGREVYPHQQARARGVMATLERVVMSPTETRLYVSGVEPNTFGVLSVTGGGSGSAASTQWRTHGMTVYSFPGDLMNKHGELTFVVKPMPALRLPRDLTAPPGSTPAKGGPWTFQFTVP